MDEEQFDAFGKLLETYCLEKKTQEATEKGYLKEIRKLLINDNISGECSPLISRIISRGIECFAKNTEHKIPNITEVCKLFQSSSVLKIPVYWEKYNIKKGEK